jgi:hypothetical protein
MNRVVMEATAIELHPYKSADRLDSVSADCGIVLFAP